MPNRKIRRLVLICIPLLATIACNVAVVPDPPSVLEGAWLLTGQDVDTFIDKTLVFDSLGNLIQVTTRVNNLGTVQRIVQDDFSRAAQVDGDAIRVVIPGSLATGFLSDIIFEGTLNSAATQADGELQTEADVFGDTVITPQGPATMIKQ